MTAAPEEFQKLLVAAKRPPPLRTATPLGRIVASLPTDAAATFHGRDVLAPAAVRLLDDEPAETLGPTVTDLARLRWPEPAETTADIRGEIIHIDVFGNLVTSLPAALLPRLTAAGRLRVGPHEVTTIVRTYGAAEPGTAVALVGSQGYIEVAVVAGRASELLAAGIGTAVILPVAAIP